MVRAHRSIGDNTGQGKPHPKQDHIGAYAFISTGDPARCPGRSLKPVGNNKVQMNSYQRSYLQTEPGLQAL